ncbi:MAG: VWA domain-containing protein [Bacilli bacterium]|nr:VWA domain-containing protein [Bacilli bacterium]
MKENFIHVAFVIDSSGSMYPSMKDVVGGFETTIEEQKKVENGECAVSLFTFDNLVKKHYIGKNINDIGSFVYSPSGMTALYDGVGQAIDKIGEWLSNMDESERPSKNLIVIMTDGEENSSTEYTASRIKEMIKHQEDVYNWSFVYMGTDLTNINDAKDLGIRMSSVSSRRNLGNSYDIINTAATKYRCSNSIEEACATMDWLFSECEVTTSNYEVENNIKLT